MSKRNPTGRGRRAASLRKGAAWCEFHREVHDPSLCVELVITEDREAFQVRMWNSKAYGWQALTTEQVHSITQQHPRAAAHIANLRHRELERMGIDHG